MKKQFYTSKRILVTCTFIMVLCMFILCGCGKKASAYIYVDESKEETVEPVWENVEESAELTEEELEENTEAFVEPEIEETPAVVSETEISEKEENSVLISEDAKLIVIDAGHQVKGNSEKEPIGPGAAEMKAKVTGGATGCSTGQKEYELNLAVAFYLREELTMRGYEVIMVRESHDVDMSNSERAAVANNADADAFIRIHANGSDNASASGTETLCQTSGNAYNASLYPMSRSLSEKVLLGVVAQTGFKNRGVKETDVMSGINWCNVPVTIVEMGFLSNPEEDTFLSTEEYRKKVAVGIADGIDSYFEQ